jgi:nicotinamide mononucleotide adenylyltransferase
VRRIGAVTGRFQPPHRQHVELFEHALATCGGLVIAVTNPDAAARRRDPASAHRHTPEANPFSYYERARLLQAALAGCGAAERAAIVPFDLTRPAAFAEYVPLDALQIVRAYGAWEHRKVRLLRDAGYEVEVIDGDRDRRLSASEVRRLLAEGSPRWRELVAQGTVPLLEELLAARAPRARAAR